MMKNRIFKVFSKWFLIGIIALFLLIIGSYEWISFSTKDHITTDVSQIEKHKTALVLGTSKYVRGGQINLFFKYRMEAVKKLFGHGKIDYVIVSGDNSIKEYNESRDMKNYLIALGIPAERIVEDFAGFSTLDSVIRAKEVFGQNSVIVVSQPFHTQRAVFIGKNHDMDIVGFNAQKVNKKYSIKTHLREYLARVKCMFDIYILGTMPKFYKEREDFPN